MHTNLFIHGFGMDENIWKDTTNSMVRDSICYSVNTAIERGKSIKEIAGDICKELKANGEAFIIIGHSMGGYIAGEMVAQNSALFKGLILVNSHTLNDSPDKKESRHKQIDFINRRGSKQYLRTFYPNLFKDKISEKWRSVFEKYTEHINTKVLINAHLAMIDREDTSVVLEKTPSLVIHGEHDRLIQSDVVFKMGERINTGRIMIDKRSSHMTMIENPNYFIEAVKKFTTDFVD